MEPGSDDCSAPPSPTPVATRAHWISGGFRAGPSRLRPPPFGRRTDIIMVLLISDNGTFCIMATPSPVISRLQWLINHYLSLFSFALLVMLDSALFGSFYCKPSTSEYSKWLPPVAFSQLSSAPTSFSNESPPLQRSPRPPTWFKRGLYSTQCF